MAKRQRIKNNCIANFNSVMYIIHIKHKTSFSFVFFALMRSFFYVTEFQNHDSGNSYVRSPPSASVSDLEYFICTNEKIIYFSFNSRGFGETYISILAYSLVFRNHYFHKQYKFLQICNFKPILLIDLLYHRKKQYILNL